MIRNVFWIPVGCKCRHTATAGFRVEWDHRAMHVCGCTDAITSFLDARICWSPLTTLCPFQSGEAKVCALSSVLIIIIIIIKNRTQIYNKRLLRGQRDIKVPSAWKLFYVWFHKPVQTWLMYVPTRSLGQARNTKSWLRLWRGLGWISNTIK